MIKKVKIYSILIFFLFCLRSSVIFSQEIKTPFQNNSDVNLKAKTYGLDFSIAGELLEHNQYNEAAEEYQRLINTIQKLREVQPDKNALNQILARAYLGFGFAVDYLNRDNEALTALQKSIELDPSIKNNLMVQITIGSIYGDLGLKLKEISHYKKIIKFNPKFYKAYFNLALALGDIGKINEAINVLKKAIQIKPNYAKAYLQMAKGSEAVGEFNKAIEYYLIAQQLYLKLGRREIENQITLRLHILLKRFGKSI